MKNLFSLLSLLVFSLSINGQSVNKQLDNFTQLRVSGSLDVTLYEGTPRAEITMVKGDIDDLVIKQKGNELHIKFRDKINWGNKRHANIDLYIGELSSIDVSAGAEVVSEFTLQADAFHADASSGGSISIALESNELEADVSSGARIDIEGNSKKLDVDVSSGAAYNGRRLIAKDVSADVSSGGSIKLWATESLDAEASSGGSIKYKGDPKHVNLDAGKYSGGSIKKM